jgi:hypothetical protein
MEDQMNQRQRYSVFLGVEEGEENQERDGWITWKKIRGRLELNVGEYRQRIGQNREKYSIVKVK